MKSKRRLNFGNREVLNRCGKTVRKSIDAYLSLSDTCESVFILSSSVRSGGLLKMCLNSSSF